MSVFVDDIISITWIHFVVIYINEIIVVCMICVWILNWRWVSLYKMSGGSMRILVDGCVIGY